MTHHASAWAHTPLRWISSASEQTTQFVYDGDGNLVKKIAPDGKVTVYIGGIYEVELNGTTVTKTTLYYPEAGAVRVIQGGNNNLYYVLKDHLGSASVTQAPYCARGAAPIAQTQTSRNHRCVPPPGPHLPSHGAGHGGPAW